MTTSAAQLIGNSNAGLAEAVPETSPAWNTRPSPERLQNTSDNWEHTHEEARSLKEVRNGIARSGKTASLYRMVMPDHLCPYGLKSKDLLERQGFTVEDHPLKTRQETEAVKKEHGVYTTPQAFTDGERTT